MAKTLKSSEEKGNYYFFAPFYIWPKRALLELHGNICLYSWQVIESGKYAVHKRTESSSANEKLYFQSSIAKHL